MDVVPATPQQRSQTLADYLPAPWCRAIERHSGVLLTQFLTRDLFRVRAHSIRDADLSPRNQSYPVVLMRAGLAAETTADTSLAEDLASHGYVVVGFDAPYRTIVVVLPDGRVIERTPANDADRFSGSQQEELATKLVEAWSADMGFTLDQLDRLNTEILREGSSGGWTCSGPGYSGTHLMVRHSCSSAMTMLDARPA